MQSASLQQAYKSTLVCRAHWALLCTTCAWLVSGCIPGVIHPLAIWRGMGPGTTPPPRTPQAPDCTGASSSSWSRAWTCQIQRVFSRARSPAASCSASKVAKKASTSDAFASACLSASKLKFEHVCMARKWKHGVPWTLFDRKYAEGGRRSGRGSGQCHQACRNITNQKNIQTAFYFELFLHIITYYYMS